MEAITTPRGSFRLLNSNDAKEKLNNGFGYHHEYEQYVIIANGKSAYAVSKKVYEDYQQEKEFSSVSPLDNVIAIGKCKSGFYMIQKYDSYYSLYTNDVLPKDFDAITLEKYMDEHRNDGSSVAGSKKDVMESLAEFIQFV